MLRLSLRNALVRVYIYKGRLRELKQALGLFIFQINEISFCVAMSIDYLIFILFIFYSFLKREMYN